MSEDERLQAVTDKKAEFSLNISAIVQGLILIASVGSVTVLLDIKDKLAEVVTFAKINETRLNHHEQRISETAIKMQDHERRIINLESRGR